MPTGLSFTHLADHPSRGGASRAAYRIHEALGKTSDIESRFFWFSRDADGQNLHGEWLESHHRILRTSTLNKLAMYVRDFLNPELRRVFDFALNRNDSLEKALAEEIDRVLVIHWVQPRDAPARTLRRVKGPIAVVLHDARFILGLGHYPRNVGTRDEPVKLTFREWLAAQFVRAILPRNRLVLVCPSMWIKKVALAAGWSDRAITVIPYPLDTDFWRREKFRPSEGRDQPVRIGFGFHGQYAAKRKGADVFAEAITRIEDFCQTTRTRIEILVFGDAQVPTVGEFQNSTISAHSLGHLRDEELRKVLGQLDLLVVPSRQENLAQIALEAQACETPIIIADNTGLESAIAPGVGWQFKNGSPEALADALLMALKRREELRARGRQARNFAINSFSSATIAYKYIDYFQRRELGQTPLP